MIEVAPEAQEVWALVFDSHLGPGKIYLFDN
jgi:hypothetical protein